MSNSIQDTHCQSLLMCPLWSSLFRNATWQVLHVYGCVALVSGLSARLEAGTLLAAIEAIFACRVSSAGCLGSGGKGLGDRRGVRLMAQARKIEEGYYIIDNTQSVFVTGFLEDRGRSKKSQITSTLFHFVCVSLVGFSLSQR
jgi:hypothetical protein